MSENTSVPCEQKREQPPVPTTAPPNFAPIYTFFEVTWPFLVTSPHTSIGKIGLFQSRKIKHWHSKTSQYYIFKEIYLYNQTSIYKFHKLKLETAAVRANLHSLMVRFSFMRDCGSILHGDSTVSTFSSNFSTITSSKSTKKERFKGKKERFKYFDSKLTLFAISS